MAKIDLVPMLLKAGACLLLFIGMLMASVAEFDKLPHRNKDAAGGGGPGTPPKAYIVDTNPYIASYICLTMAVIILEVGNIVICVMGGIDKQGDAIWQAVNAFLAFCVACMWCMVVHKVRTVDYALCKLASDAACGISTHGTTPIFDLYILHWLALLLAFAAMALFIVAAVLSMGSQKGDNAAESRAQQPQRVQSWNPPPTTSESVEPEA